MDFDEGTSSYHLQRVGRAPQIPTCDGAVGLPTLGTGFELGLRGQLFRAERDREALSDAVVVERQHVRAAEAEHEEHLDRPAADASNFRQALDDGFVVQLLNL